MFVQRLPGQKDDTDYSVFPRPSELGDDKTILFFLDYLDRETIWTIVFFQD